MFEQVFCAGQKDWQPRPVDERLVEPAAELLAQNAEYFSLIGQLLPGPRDVEEDLAALPPGMTAESKSYLLVYHKGQPAAVLDFVTGYPRPSCGFIGLFVLATPLHRQGLGGQLLRLVEQAARACGLDSLRLGCYAANLPGAAFWKKQGFAVVEERTLQETSGEHRLLVMEKSI